MFLDDEFKAKIWDFWLLLRSWNIYGSSSLTYHPTKFTLELVFEFDCDHLPLIFSPLDPSVKFSSHFGELIVYHIAPHRLVGKINYLTHTRRGLLYSVQHLSQFLQEPRLPHFDAALRVVCHLRLNLGQGLFFTLDRCGSLLAFCDAYWGSWIDSRWSVSGVYIIFGASPISYNSKKQTSISLSSAEVAYHSMRIIVAELTWLNRLLYYLVLPPTLLIFVHFDS